MDELIKIKHKYTGSVLFECKAGSLKLALQMASESDANLWGADLRGANLRDANLWDANLWDANLWDADLRGANLWDAKNAPLIITGWRWSILIESEYIRIGCERHTTKDWAYFNDDQIEAMDSSALDFWEKHKDIILKLAEGHQGNNEEKKRGN